MEAGSSSSVPPPIQQQGYDYEVFLSFRGKDTRLTFADHLYTDLKDKGIHTFRDDEELRKGEAIKPELLNAINQSQVSVPILSEGYAWSKWCLMELAQMVKCMEAGNQKILPVFYHVDPRQVRHQEGEYGKAFAEHQEKYPSMVVEEWRTALETVGKLKGWHLNVNGYEGSLRSKVVLEVFKELKKYQHIDITDNVVGIDDHVDGIMDLLDIDIPDIRIGVIWGMAGSGKTTIAKFIYNQLMHKFDHCCFIGNISESSKSKGIEFLQAQLVSDFLGRQHEEVFYVGKGKQVLRHRIYAKKVLIVLDDVDQAEQLSSLMSYIGAVASGSRIIITTRNRDILEAEPTMAHWSYEVKEMDEEDALLLFCKHAFKQDFMVLEYDNLSREIVKEIGGIPLAIEVVASYLSRYLEDKDVWEEALERLKRDETIQDKLRVSIVSLNHEEREVFLDIACFFHGMDAKIPFPMWKALELYPVRTINDLLAKSLIKVIDGCKLWMHNLLRDLGREEVRAENHKRPGERSRLWRSEDGIQVLEDEEGTEKVQAICLAREAELEHCHFSGEDFRKLSQLLFLDLGYTNLNGVFEKKCLRKLKWIGWHGIGQTQLPTPSVLHLKDLVVLDLSESSIGENWDGWNLIQDFKKLEVLNLMSCQQLRSTPHFKLNLPLKRLILEDCRELSIVHSSIGQLTALESLNLKKCQSLNSLPVELGSMFRLMELFVDGVPTERLPEGMQNLGTLSAKSCKSLKTLSLDYCDSLKELNLSHTSVVEFCSSARRLKNLQVLDISCSMAKCFPPFLEELQKLEVINASGCQSLGEVPVELGRLASLRILRLDHTGITSIPASIKEVNHLEVLDLGSSKCEETLPELPSSLVKVSVTCRTSVNVIPNLADLINLKELEFLQCNALARLPKEVKGLSKLRRLKLQSTSIGSFPEEMGELCQLRELIISDCDKLESLPKLPSGLRRLLISRCSSLSQLPKLLNLENLRAFSLLQCPNIVEIPNLGDLKSLRALRIRAPLVTIHGLEMLSSLVYLSLEECLVGNLTDLSKLGGVSSLEVAFCGKLQKIEGLCSLGSLKRLKITRCETLQEVEGIQELVLIEELCICQCPALKNFPNLSTLQRLRVLKLASSSPVRTLPTSSIMRNLKTLNLQILENLVEVDGLGGLVSLETLVISGCTGIETIPDLSRLQQLKTLQLHALGKLREIRGLSKLLEVLVVSLCNAVEIFPSLSRLQKLKTLKLRGLEKVVEIQGLFGLESLESFAISHCDAVMALSGLRMMQNLRELSIYSCRRLTDIQEIDELVTLESLVVLGCKQINILSYIPMLWNLKTLEFELWMDGIEIQEMPEFQSLEILSIYSKYKIERKLLGLARGRNFKRLELFLGGMGSLSVDCIVRDLRLLNQVDPMVASEAQLVVWPYKMKGLMQLLTQPEFTALELQDPELSMKSIQRSIAEMVSLGKMSIYKTTHLLELRVQKLLNLLGLKESEVPQLNTILETPMLQQLKKLELWYCNHLEGYRAITELQLLEELSIEHSDAVMALPNLYGLHKLKRLVVRSCGQLEDIQGICELECLEKLHIENCNALHALPTMSRLQKLKTVVFRSCQLLKDIQGLSELGQLEELTVHDCCALEALPNMSSLQKLKTVVLRSCLLLKDIQGLSELGQLEELTVHDCCALEALPNMSRLQKLKTVVLRSCLLLKDIQGLSELGQLEELTVQDCCALEALPNMSRLQKLKTVVLRSCLLLKDMQGLSELGQLDELTIQDYSGLEALPDFQAVRELDSLEELSIGYSDPLHELPNVVKLQKLKQLTLCTRKQFLDIQGFGELEWLEVLVIEECGALEALPNLSMLKKLKTLVLRSCALLKDIDGFSELVWLEEIVIKKCDALEALPNLSRLQMLKRLELHWCKLVKDIPGLGKLILLEELEINVCDSLEASLNLCGLHKLKRLVLHFYYQLQDIQGFCKLESLEVLNIKHCYSLKALPNLSGLQKLKRLELHLFSELNDIPGLGELKWLEELSIDSFYSLKALPNMASLQRLKKVELRNCGQLEDIEGLVMLNNLKYLYIKECRSLKIIRHPRAIFL